MTRPLAAARLALLAAALLAALGLGEAAVRLTGRAPAVKAIRLSDEENVYRRSTNPILGFELKPGYRNDDPNPNHSFSSTNSHGQRDVERAVEKPAGGRRILLLGDSVVEGHGIMELDSTLSRRLEALYPDGRTEVLNFGVSGYCTLSEVELLETKGLRFEPDVVVLVFLENDFRNFNLEAFELETRIRPAVAEELFLRSHLFRLASLRLDLYGFAAQADPGRWNSRAIGDNNVVDGLRRLAALARVHGFETVVAVWPEVSKGRLVDGTTMPGGQDLVIERLASMVGLRSFRMSRFFEREIGRSLEITLRRLFLPGDAIHPSALGATLAARALREVLDDLDRYAPLPLAAGREDAEAVSAAAALGAGEEPNLARVHNNRGRKLREAGRLRQAEEELRTALAIEPDLAEAHFNLGVVHQEAGRPAAAATAYRACLALDDDNVAAQHNLGLILLEEGELDEAEARFRQARELAPAYAAAELGLGNVAARRGRLEVARAAFQRAAKLDPASAAAEANLGSTFLAAGEPAAAIPYYRRALALEPEHLEARANLGRALELTGDLDAAIAEYREALRLAADHPVPRAALERLGALGASGDG